MGSDALIARGGTRGSIAVELAIAVVVVVVLALVSLPSYAEHVRRGSRAEMQAFLLEVGARQQQRLADRHDYAATIADLGLSLPRSLAGKYALSLSVPAAAPPRFTVSAAPHGPQAADGCGTLSLSEAGQRAPADCWR